MNLSFSTRGWNHLTWTEQLRDAAEFQFQGIEWYNLHKCPELTGPDGAFHKYHWNDTIRALREKNLAIPCLDTSFDLSREDAAAAEKLGELFETAMAFRVPGVAVCALEDREDAIRETLGILLKKAEETGVCLLIKTVGIFADTGRLRTWMDDYASDSLACLWDVHHPIRDFGEKPDTTIRNLGGYVKHVHLRDSDETQYHLIGEGQLPMKEIMNALYSIDYTGFISLEWKPEWLPELQDREIIYPHFLNYMNRFDNPRGKRKTLYYNHDGTGRYVWKKDELIDQTFGQVLDRKIGRAHV